MEGCFGFRSLINKLNTLMYVVDMGDECIYIIVTFIPIPKKNPICRLQIHAVVISNLPINILALMESFRVSVAV